jgi:hypothetical protein
MPTHIGSFAGGFARGFLDARRYRMQQQYYDAMISYYQYIMRKGGYNPQLNKFYNPKTKQFDLDYDPTSAYGREQAAEEAKGAARERTGGGPARLAGEGGFSLDQMVTMAQKAGFKGEDAAHMAALAMAESSGNPDALGPAQEIGLTQINPHAHPDLVDLAKSGPQGQFDAAFKVYTNAGNKFSDWSTDPSSPHFTPNNNGMRFMDEARKALSAVEGATPKAETTKQKAEKLREAPPTIGATPPANQVASADNTGVVPPAHPLTVDPYWRTNHPLSDMGGTAPTAPSPVNEPSIAAREPTTTTPSTGAPTSTQDLTPAELARSLPPPPPEEPTSPAEGGTQFTLPDIPAPPSPVPVVNAFAGMQLPSPYMPLMMQPYKDQTDQGSTDQQTISETWKGGPIGYADGGNVGPTIDSPDNTQSNQPQPNQPKPPQPPRPKFDIKQPQFTLPDIPAAPSPLSMINAFGGTQLQTGYAAGGAVSPGMMRLQSQAQRAQTIISQGIPTQQTMPPQSTGGWDTATLPLSDLMKQIYDEGQSGQANMQGFYRGGMVQQYARGGVVTKFDDGGDATGDPGPGPGGVAVGTPGSGQGTDAPGFGSSTSDANANAPGPSGGLSSGWGGITGAVAAEAAPAVGSPPGSVSEGIANTAPSGTNFGTNFGNSPTGMGPVGFVHGNDPGLAASNTGGLALAGGISTAGIVGGGGYGGAPATGSNSPAANFNAAMAKMRGLFGGYGFGTGVAPALAHAFGDSSAAAFAHLASPFGGLFGPGVRGATMGFPAANPTLGIGGTPQGTPAPVGSNYGQPFGSGIGGPPGLGFGNQGWGFGANPAAPGMAAPSLGQQAVRASMGIGPAPASTPAPAPAPSNNIAVNRGVPVASPASPASLGSVSWGGGAGPAPVASGRFGGGTGPSGGGRYEEGGPIEGIPTINSYANGGTVTKFYGGGGAYGGAYSAPIYSAPSAPNPSFSGAAASPTSTADSPNYPYRTGPGGLLSTDPSQFTLNPTGSFGPLSVDPTTGRTYAQANQALINYYSPPPPSLVGAERQGGGRSGVYYTGGTYQSAPPVNLYEPSVAGITGATTTAPATTSPVTTPAAPAALAVPPPPPEQPQRFTSTALNPLYQAPASKITHWNINPATSGATGTPTGVTTTPTGQVKGGPIGYQEGGDVGGTSPSVLGPPPGLPGSTQQIPPYYYNPATYAPSGAPVGKGISATSIPTYVAAPVPTYQQGGMVMRYQEGADVEQADTTGGEDAGDIQEASVRMPSLGGGGGGGGRMLQPRMMRPPIQRASSLGGVRGGGGAAGGAGWYNPSQDNPVTYQRPDDAPPEAPMIYDDQSNLSPAITGAIGAGLHLLGQVLKIGPFQQAGGPPDQQALQERQAMASRAGTQGMTEKVEAVKNNINPYLSNGERALGEAQANLAALEAVYKWDLINVGPQKAQEDAAAFMMYAHQMVAENADQVIKSYYKGDTQAMLDAMHKANDYMLTGNNLFGRVSDDGKTFHLENYNGDNSKLNWMVDIAPKVVAYAALQLRDGGLYWNQLEQLADKFDPVTHAINQRNLEQQSQREIEQANQAVNPQGGPPNQQPPQTTPIPFRPPMSPVGGGQPTPIPANVTLPQTGQPLPQGGATTNPLNLQQQMTKPTGIGLPPGATPPPDQGAQATINSLLPQQVAGPGAPLPPYNASFNAPPSPVQAPPPMATTRSPDTSTAQPALQPVGADQGGRPPITPLTDTTANVNAAPLGEEELSHRRELISQRIRGPEGGFYNAAGERMLGGRPLHYPTEADASVITNLPERKAWLQNARQEWSNNAKLVDTMAAERENREIQDFNSTQAALKTAFEAQKQIKMQEQVNINEAKRKLDDETRTRTYENLKPVGETITNPLGGSTTVTSEAAKTVADTFGRPYQPTPKDAKPGETISAAPTINFIPEQVNRDQLADAIGTLYRWNQHDRTLSMPVASEAIRQMISNPNFTSDHVKYVKVPTLTDPVTGGEQQLAAVAVPDNTGAPHVYYLPRNVFDDIMSIRATFGANAKDYVAKQRAANEQSGRMWGGIGGVGQTIGQHFTGPPTTPAPMQRSPIGQPPGPLPWLFRPTPPGTPIAPKTGIPARP